MGINKEISRHHGVSFGYYISWQLRGYFLAITGSTWRWKVARNRLKILPRKSCNCNVVPAPTRMHKGLHASSHFLGKGGGGGVLGCSLGKISRESPEKWVFFVVANGNQCP